jgi:hypothetical protein
VVLELLETVEIEKVDSGQCHESLQWLINLRV